MISDQESDERSVADLLRALEHGRDHSANEEDCDLLQEFLWRLDAAGTARFLEYTIRMRAHLNTDDEIPESDYWCNWRRT